MKLLYICTVAVHVLQIWMWHAPVVNVQIPKQFSLAFIAFLFSLSISWVGPNLVQWVQSILRSSNAVAEQRAEDNAEIRFALPSCISCELQLYFFCSCFAFHEYFLCESNVQSTLKGSSALAGDNDEIRFAFLMYYLCISFVFLLPLSCTLCTFPVWGSSALAGAGAGDNIEITLSIIPTCHQPLKNWGQPGPIWQHTCPSSKQWATSENNNQQIKLAHSVGPTGQCTPHIENSTCIHFERQLAKTNRAQEDHNQIINR